MQGSNKEQYERLEAWIDGGSVQIIAVTKFGDPVDCNAGEAREFAMNLLALCNTIDSGST